MRLVLSTGEVVFCVCAIAQVLYLSPFFISQVNTNASNAWELLLVWDDRENFLDNPVIQSGLSLPNLYSMFTMTKINVYEPFGWLLKALQVQYLGMDPWWIRIVSAVLHIMAATILARVSALLLDMMTFLSKIKTGCRVNQAKMQQQAKRHWLGSCISATMFAIHPVHVEVVGWPSAQPYALCALFSNFALYVYMQAIYRRLQRVPIGVKNMKAKLMACIYGGGGWSDLTCCGLYLGALLSKSACILLPAAFFLTDVLVLSALESQPSRPSVRQCWWYIRGKIPFVAILCTFITLTLASNYNGMNPEADLVSLTLAERIMKAVTMPVWILRLLLWPTRLRPHYQLRAEDLSLANPECLVSLVVSLALLLLTTWLLQHRHTPQHLLAMMYFATMVLPVSGFIQHGMVSAGTNRYAYMCSMILVPYGGAVLAPLFANDDTIDKEPEQSQTRPKQSWLQQQRTIGWSVLVLVAGTYLSLSTTLMGSWRNEDALFESSLRKDPTDWRILDQRATYLVTSGRYSSSDDECRHLWQLAYYYTPVGTLKAELFRLKLQIWLNGIDNGVCEGYRKLLKAHPDNCHAHNNVGVCLIEQGDVRQARQEFERALMCPGYEQLYAVPRQNLERLNEWSGLKEEAQRHGAETSVPQIKSQIMF